MPYTVDFDTVSTVRLESSPVAASPVGLRANEARFVVPVELAPRFKFARQKSRLAGTIRGSYFAFKNEY